MESPPLEAVSAALVGRRLRYAWSWSVGFPSFKTEAAQLSWKAALEPHPPEAGSAALVEFQSFKAVAAQPFLESSYGVAPTRSRLRSPGWQEVKVCLVLVSWVSKL